MYMFSISMCLDTMPRVKQKSCPTRCEPGAGLVIPTRTEPGRDLEGAVRQLKGSLPAWRVDHRIDGDRHERSAGAHPGAGAAGVGGNAGAGVSTGPGRRRAALRLDRGRAAALRLPSVEARGPWC